MLEGTCSNTGVFQDWSHKPRGAWLQRFKALRLLQAILSQSCSVAAGLFESWSLWVTGGKGTEPCPDRVVEGWGLFEPRGRTIPGFQLWSGRKVGKPVTILSPQRFPSQVETAQQALFLDFCIQIQQAITEHLKIPWDCVMCFPYTLPSALLLVFQIEYSSSLSYNDNVYVHYQVIFHQ